MKKILLLPLLVIFIYGEGKFSGVTYFDYTYDLTKQTGDYNAFDLKRVYFTYQQDISDKISYKFQTDVGQLKIDNVDVDDGDVLVSTDKTQFVAYLKKAQLDWKTSYGKLIFGMQGMNMFNVTEKTWGFRFLQKSAMDKYKFSSSADLGVGFHYVMIGYNGLNLYSSVLMTNGTGYKKNEDDKHKKISAQFVYGEKKLVKKDGFNIGFSFSTEQYDLNENNTEDKIVTSFYTGYAKNRLRIGGELDFYKDSGDNTTKQIIAGYASYKLSDNLEGLVYFDMYDPNTSADKDGNTDLIVGLNYKPAKGLTMTPNIRISTPDEGDGTTIFMMNFEFKF